jgi:hypothetical protein
MTIVQSTHQISTVRVKLASSVGGVETDTALVQGASDLDVSAGPHELSDHIEISNIASARQRKTCLSAGDRASRHDTGAMGCLAIAAVCNNGRLNIAN